MLLWHGTAQLLQAKPGIGKQAQRGLQLQIREVHLMLLLQVPIIYAHNLTLLYAGALV